MEGNRASGFICPSCGHTEAFIHGYDHESTRILGLALTCTSCEWSWVEPVG